MNVIKLGFKSVLSPIARILISSKIRIVMYHRFGRQGQIGGLSASSFDSHCAYFKKHFNVFSISKFAEDLHSQRKTPPNSLIITIDDGYDDLFYYAYPVLKKYSLPATVYLTTGFVEKELWLWPDIIRYIVNGSKLNEYKLSFRNREKLLRFETSEDKDFAWDWITTFCLDLWENDKQELIRQLSTELKVTIPNTPVSDFNSLSWEQIKEMSSNGIEFGSHSHSHPILSKLEANEKQKEIENSKKILENMIQKPVTSFCYPNGQKPDFDEETVDYVKNSGYRCATVAYRGFNDLNSDPFRLVRITLSENKFDLTQKLNGVEYLSDQLKSWRRNFE